MQDGVVVVWHDENITEEKCKDTAPVVSISHDFRVSLVLILHADT